MLDDSEATAAARERLSALLDGELDAGAVVDDLQRIDPSRSGS